MNGVRRLLGGASSSSQPPEPAPPPPPQSSVLPLFSSKNPTNPSWPPQDEPQSQGSFPGNAKPIAALSFKKDKPRPSLSNDNVDFDRSWDSTRPNSNQPSSSSRRPYHAHSNSFQNSAPNSPSSYNSSPRRVPVNGDRNPSRKSTEQSTESAWIVQRNSLGSSTRDELLLSLMASEAVVDSRGYDVLDTEQVEELKTEHTVLSSRLATMTKKLSLEIKLRDAAVSLSRINSPNKKPEEQLETANRRVDAAQREVWRLSEVTNEVGKRLLEHRAAVLSISVRNMEKKMSPSNSEDSGYDSSNRSTLMTPATATSTFSASSAKQAKFDGAHLFAGHENAVVPRKRLSPEAASKEITALETKLKAAASSLAESSKIQAEMKKELSHLKLEKQEVETIMGMELQNAGDTIASLQRELPRLESLDQEVQNLRQERAMWEEDKLQLESFERETSILKTRIQELEMGVVERSGGADKMLEDLRESHRRELTEKDSQLQKLKDQLAEERAGWERDKNALEDEKMDDLSQLHQEMDKLRAADEQVLQQANDELNTTLRSLRGIVQKFNIPVSERDPQTSSMAHLLNAITRQLDNVYGRVDQLEKAREGGAKVEQLEMELRSVLDKQRSTAKELEEVRRERDAIRRETLTSSIRSITSSPDRSRSDSVKLPPLAATPNFTPETSEYGPDVEGAKFIAALQPLWNILPSPEARASKFSPSNARSYRGSPATSNAALPGTNGPPPPTSLSELDVRSLKTLYDPRQQAGSAVNGQFTLEAFIARVNALVSDDRALIERLLRFAQAHDLLKKNAERAQKLAQDGNVALDTYQKQVKLLESRNSTLNTRVADVQDELRLLHDAIERATADKHELEAFAAEQAETCRQLSEANNTLSARALTLAEEAANAPQMVRKQLDDCKRQLDESKKLLEDRAKELENARDEIDAMRSAEQGQRIALLDELNTMQTENGQLRQQLRAANNGK